MLDLSQLRPSGVFLRRDALAHGYRDRDLSAALRGQVLQRVRHGAYVDAGRWADATPEDRHALAVHAVLLSHRPGSVVPSHTSAAVLHGLSLYRPDLTRVHLTVLDGAAGRRGPDVVYHQGDVGPSDLVTAEVTVMEPVRTALEAASLADVEAGLVVLDALLHRGLADLGAVWAAYKRMTRWPGTLRLQTTVRLARHGAESVGESRARHLCWWAGVPEPVLQHPVRDRDGQLIGLSDFWWPDQRLLGEFDGAVKYGRLLRPGETAGDAVFREKQREDRMREAERASMIRFVWSDLSQRGVTARRLRHALGLDR